MHHHVTPVPVVSAILSHYDFKCSKFHQAYLRMVPKGDKKVMLWSNSSWTLFLIKRNRKYVNFNCHPLTQFLDIIYRYIRRNSWRACLNIEGCKNHVIYWLPIFLFEFWKQIITILYGIWFDIGLSHFLYRKSVRITWAEMCSDWHVWRSHLACMMRPVWSSWQNRWGRVAFNTSSENTRDNVLKPAYLRIQYFRVSYLHGQQQEKCL